MRKRRQYFSNNFLNAHGGGGVAHAHVVGGTHQNVRYTGGTPHHVQPPSGGTHSTLPSGGTSPQGGVSSLGSVGVSAVGISGIGYGAGSLYGGLPYYSPFVDGSWGDSQPLNDNMPAGKPALTVVTPKSGKWAEEKYQWLVIEVPANDASLHKVVWGKKEDGSMSDMRQGQMAILTSEYSISDDQSQLSEYHYAEGDSSPVGSVKLPAWKKALPMIGIVSGLSAIWYLNKNKQEWLRGHRILVGVGLTLGVIACSIPLIVGNRKLSATKASAAGATDDQKISDLLTQIAATRPNIKSSDIDKAKSWISTNLSADEKPMLIDFYTILSKVTASASANDAAAVYVSAMTSLTSKYPASAVTTFMQKLVALNEILKTKNG